MEKEKFRYWATAAEVISALAIVISLLYVGYEIRQTQILSQRSIDEMLFSRNSEANRILVENADMAEIVIAAQSGPDSLSPAERIRYLAYEHTLLDNWEVAFYSHYDGILNDEYWDDWDAFYKNQAKRRPKFAWTENRHNFVGPFAEYVDEFMASEYGRN